MTNEIVDHLTGNEGVYSRASARITRECRGRISLDDTSPVPEFGADIELWHTVSFLFANHPVPLRQLIKCRVSSTKDLQVDSLYAEIVAVETEISRYRSTSKNLTNYIPLLRLLEPILWRGAAAYSAQIGQRRIAYNDQLLNRLKEAVNKGTDKPCIQGSVLRDPESVALSSKELLSISLSMMAVCFPNIYLLNETLLTSHRAQIARNPPSHGRSFSWHIIRTFNSALLMKFKNLNLLLEGRLRRRKLNTSMLLLKS